jgi:hypothetical protein
MPPGELDRAKYHNQEDLELHNHCYENLKFNKLQGKFALIIIL